MSEVLTDDETRPSWVTVSGLQALLADPVAVHVNMMRGSIATPSAESLVHLRPSQLALKSDIDHYRSLLREAGEVIQRVAPADGEPRVAFACANVKDFANDARALLSRINEALGEG